MDTESKEQRFIMVEYG